MNKRVLQDFSLIHQAVQKAKLDFNLLDDSNGFYFVILPLVLDLQDDEIDEAITDNFYQTVRDRKPGKDRGIDAIHVKSEAVGTVIHLFSAKYSSLFDKSEGFISKENYYRFKDTIESRYVHWKRLKQKIHL